MKAKRLLLVLLSVLLLIFLAVGYSVYQYREPGEVLAADAAIILGAAVWRGQPSPVFKERINHGVNLYHSGRVESLIFTGGVGLRDTESEAEVGKQYAVAQGVDPRHIYTDSQSTITYQNLKNAQALAADLDIKTFLIVSDPLHMKRSLSMAGDLGLDASPSPTPTTRYRTWRSKLPFLIRESFYLISYRVKDFLGLCG